MFTLSVDSAIFNKATATRTSGLKNGKSSVFHLVDDNMSENRNSKCDVSFGMLYHKNIHDYRQSPEHTSQNWYMFLGLNEQAKIKVPSRVSNGSNSTKSSAVFKGKLFCFSSSFPVEQVSCSVNILYYYYVSCLDVLC